MKELNKISLRQMHTDYVDYCSQQECCEHCKLYDERITCEVAFAYLNSKGKIKLKYDDSEV